ncbi:MAG: DNA-processing protein DprA [Bdellovibrionales bacterium]|nr:DNA-processing protein DprA [Bdellovibrionales bacterium]
MTWTAAAPKILTRHQLPLLSHLRKAPHPLYSLGCTPDADSLCIGIVGARKASLHSLGVGAYLARELARAGVWVVSGLAYGVDAAAHRGALAVGGKTLAVLAHGLDTVYPAAHRQLARKIVSSGGGLLSQFSSGTPARRPHFPERNRTLAGLCRGIVVVEAAERSGSLITAGFAADEGREVFMVPGPFGAKAFAGSHRWIAQGAHLLHSVDDLFAEWKLPPNVPMQPSLLSERCQRFQIYTVGDFYDGSGSAALVALESALSTGECIEWGSQAFLYLGL